MREKVISYKFCKVTRLCDRVNVGDKSKKRIKDKTMALSLFNNMGDAVNGYGKGWWKDKEFGLTNAKFQMSMGHPSRNTR